MEIWKSIPGYEGFYEVSNMGRVRSVTRLVERRVPSTRDKTALYTYKSRMIPAWTTKKGYFRCTLNKGGGKKNFMVHRLVAMAFIPNPTNKPQINHKNCNKKDNRADNLEWATGRENYMHSVVNGKQEHRFKKEDVQAQA